MKRRERRDDGKMETDGSRDGWECGRESREKRNGVRCDHTDTCTEDSVVMCDAKLEAREGERPQEHAD